MSEMTARLTTLFLAVGPPGTGKTTLARRIESERGALRLTKDKWEKALYGDENPERASDVIEVRLVEIALRALELGTDVVLDFGLWSKDERTCLRRAAAWTAASRQRRTPPGRSPTPSSPRGRTPSSAPPRRRSTAASRSPARRGLPQLGGVARAPLARERRPYGRDGLSSPEAHPSMATGALCLSALVGPRIMAP